MAEDKTSGGTAGPQASDDQPYWTPERLRAARPLPLPHPDAPPPETPPQTDDQLPSVSGAGSPGSGEVAPDDANLLDSETEGSDKP